MLLFIYLYIFLITGSFFPLKISKNITSLSLLNIFLSKAKVLRKIFKCIRYLDIMILILI